MSNDEHAKPPLSEDLLVALHEAVAASRLAMEQTFADNAEPPAGTFLRLFRQAEVQYLGILRLVDDVPLAAAAEPILRSLIEFHAHARWIAEGTGGGRSVVDKPSATRALCFELGTAKVLVRAGMGTVGAVIAGLPQQIQGILAQAPELMQDPTVEALREAVTVDEYDRVTADVVHDLDSLQARHRAAGCKCNGRSQDTVQPVLKALAAQGDWLALVMLSLMSAIAHHGSPAIASIMENRFDGETTNPIPILYAAYGGDLLFEAVRAMVKDGGGSDVAVAAAVAAVNAHPVVAGFSSGALARYSRAMAG